MNRVMNYKLRAGEALDVEKVGRDLSAEGPAFVGVYQLDRFDEGKDYCVGSSQTWIWSIGRRKSDGAVFAATDARFYQNPAFDCLFLR